MDSYHHPDYLHAAPLSLQLRRVVVRVRDMARRLLNPVDAIALGGPATRLCRIRRRPVRSRNHNSHSLFG